MEVYIGPPEARPDATLSRGQVLTALAEAGFSVAKMEETPATGGLRAFWIVSLVESDISLHFQETDAGLVFVTLDQSMFDASDIPDRICGIFERLGWEVDQDNVGERCARFGVACSCGDPHSTGVGLAMRR